MCIIRNPRYEKAGNRRRFEFTEGDDEKDKEKEKAIDQELSDKDKYHRKYLSKKLC